MVTQGRHIRAEQVHDCDVGSGKRRCLDGADGIE